jgi:hypothetical protein
VTVHSVAGAAMVAGRRETRTFIFVTWRAPLVIVQRQRGRTGDRRKQAKPAAHEAPLPSPASIASASHNAALAMEPRASFRSPLKRGSGASPQ